MNKPTKVIRYKNFDKLVASFYQCKVSQITKQRKDIRTDVFLESLKERKVWGYAQDTVIRLWYEDNVDDKELLAFFGHEIGHMNGREYANWDKEESKACEFEDVAVEAYKLMLKYRSKK